MHKTLLGGFNETQDTYLKGLNEMYKTLLRVRRNHNMKLFGKNNKNYEAKTNTAVFCSLSFTLLYWALKTHNVNMFMRAFSISTKI